MYKNHTLVVEIKCLEHDMNKWIRIILKPYSYVNSIKSSRVVFLDMPIIQLMLYVNNR